MSWLPRRRATPAGRGRWVVVDVESTGSRPARDRLLAVAAVAVRHEGRRSWIDLADSFDGVLGHAGALACKPNILLHGIGVGAQRPGPEPAQVLKGFTDWAQGATRLGYHSALIAR